ncbi:hypothetical protein CERZMDRAFT_103052 [Cercospora zeae-maydis SCOH1-5]|uniref:Uncharacterized protein n=1 Tax=Cercospora zeae-maydis SCOH1-5 TaxID=717836 RepID=A0A6A6F2I8_9PEZI|nr:hypothetical protein CERZMDRAFT_103052 [Cercospora zeae-maydis SCOH1-5]
MSIATIKALTGIGAIASVPLGVAYVMTADHSALSWGTSAAHRVENRFKVFDDRATDSLPPAQRRHRHQKIRDAMAADLSKTDVAL